MSAGFEVPEFEVVGLKIRLSGATGQIAHELNNRERWSLVLIMVNFRSTKLDRNFLLAGAQ